MNKNFVILGINLLIISTFVIACNSKSPANENATAFNNVEVDTAMVTPQNPNLSKNEQLKNKKFIRTIESTFQVKDVKQSTQGISNFTTKLGGYVSNMSLNSEILSTNKIQTSADSLTEIKEYILKNDLTLRVPNRQLDSLLGEIFKTVVFWDNYEVKTDDITFKVLSNSLNIKRLEEYSIRNKGNIDKKKGNISVASEAENDVLTHQNKADDYRIGQQSMEDQTNFSTVNLHIYQAPSIQKTIIADIKNIEEYRPNIFLRLWSSIKDGWQVLEEIIVFFIKIWSLFLIVGIGYYFIRKYRKF